MDEKNFGGTKQALSVASLDRLDQQRTEACHPALGVLAVVVSVIPWALAPPPPHHFAPASPPWMSPLATVRSASRRLEATTNTTRPRLCLDI